MKTQTGLCICALWVAAVVIDQAVQNSLVTVENKEPAEPCRLVCASRQYLGGCTFFRWGLIMMTLDPVNEFQLLQGNW